MSRSFRTEAAWGVLPLIALVLYCRGVTAWFQKDDFAWLAWRDPGALLVAVSHGPARNIRSEYRRLADAQ